MCIGPRPRHTVAHVKGPARVCCCRHARGGCEGWGAALHASGQVVASRVWRENVGRGPACQLINGSARYARGTTTMV